MRKPSDMFDRDQEWAALERFIEDDKPGATLGVVTGRRRQGKSFLLEATCEATNGFYFAAQEATNAESLAMIGKALTKYVDAGVPFTPSDWPTVIDTLLRLGRERPMLIVIDEFPYLARVNPALPSAIQAAYSPRRPERTTSRTRLLLCGSSLSFMGKLLSGNAPLRGRASLDMSVSTLDYQRAADFWGLTDPYLAILVHAIVGGTPAYRTEMIRYDTPRDRHDFDPWVVRAILSPASPLFLEARYLLAEESDLRDTALYHSVLAAIAEGNSGRGGIASHVGRRSNELVHPLTVLEDAGLIAREVDAFRANRTNFRIREPLLTFYHAIMRPFWAQLMRASSTERVWQRSKERFDSNVLGPHFKRLCREWTLHYAGDRSGDWPAQVTSGTVNDPVAKTMHEIDIVAVGHSDTGRRPLLVLGEAKWNEVMGLGHLARLRAIHQLVTQSDKYDTGSTRLVCFSGVGFSEGLRAEAKRAPIDLIGLNDLYRPMS